MTLQALGWHDFPMTGTTQPDHMIRSRDPAASTTRLSQLNSVPWRRNGVSKHAGKQVSLAMVTCTPLREIV